jgi:hypothetical protein
VSSAQGTKTSCLALAVIVNVQRDRPGTDISLDLAALPESTLNYISPISWLSCRHTPSLLGLNQPIFWSPEVTLSQRGIRLSAALLDPGGDLRR